MSRHQSLINYLVYNVLPNAIITNTSDDDIVTVHYTSSCGPLVIKIEMNEYDKAAGRFDRDAFVKHVMDNISSLAVECQYDPC